jgi:hypothetical protein
MRYSASRGCRRSARPAGGVRPSRQALPRSFRPRVDPERLREEDDAHRDRAGVEAAAPESASRTRWFEAALLYAAGEFEAASERYAEIGAGPDEAYTRLRAAAHLPSEAGEEASGRGRPGLPRSPVLRGRRRNGVRGLRGIARGASLAAGRRGRVTPALPSRPELEDGCSDSSGARSPGRTSP